MTLSDRLAGRRNALNLTRLLLAGAVIVSHAWAQAGAVEPSFAGLNLGGWAVGGFFAISGYLIPQSRCRLSAPEFLSRRARRILPGFWACLLVTAFVFAPVAAMLSGAEYEGGAAAGYALTNATTWLHQLGVGAELDGTTFAGAWDVSLWTVSYEIGCYLVAGALLSFSVARRHQTVLAGLLVVACTVMNIGPVGSVPNPGTTVAWLGTYFAAGWLVASLRDRLIPTPASVALSLAVAAGVALFNTVLSAAPLALGLLLAAAMASRLTWGSTHDLSYGLYLYGWPSAQVLLVAGVHDPVVLVPLSLAVSCALAAASWFGVERRFLVRRETRQPVVNQLRLAPPKRRLRLRAG